MNFFPEVIRTTKSVLSDVAAPSDNPVSGYRSQSPMTQDTETLKGALQPVMECLRRVDGGVVQGLRFETVTPQKEGATVRYIEIEETFDCVVPYTIGMFVFPPGGVIPLHDHPGMCVMTRVLKGELNVVSYNYDGATGATEPTAYTDAINLLKKSLGFDFGNIKNTGRPIGTRVNAKMIGASVIKCNEVKALYPQENNLHEFKAGEEGAVVLDVILPPYHDDDGRDCNYYSKIQSDDEGNFLLELINQPSDFSCKRGEYIPGTKK